jgi:hypothetical protein
LFVRINTSRVLRIQVNLFASEKMSENLRKSIETCVLLTRNLNGLNVDRYLSSLSDNDKSNIEVFKKFAGASHCGTCSAISLGTFSLLPAAFKHRGWNCGKKAYIQQRKKGECGRSHRVFAALLSEVDFIRFWKR